MCKCLLDHISNSFKYVVLLALVFMQQDAGAQKKESVYLDSLFKRYADTSTQVYSSTRPYYIGKWSSEITSSLKIVRQLDDRLGIIEVSTQTTFDSLKQQMKLASAKDDWKLSPSLEKLFKKNNEGTQKYILSTVNINSTLAVLQREPKEVAVIYINKPSQSIVVKCKAKYIRDNLLQLKELILIDAASEAHAETGIIGYNRSLHGINAVDYFIPGANGKNIVTSVKEQKMDEADLDLWKRVLPSPLAAGATSNHATVIASIIGGAGNSFYDGRGIAWGTAFFPSSFSNLFADDAAVLNANKVTVQNHSYGTIIQQFYGAEAVSYDVLTWLNKNFVAVMSAGNQGEAFATEGRYANLAGYANLTGNFKMAKNVITVGAIDKDENIPAQSSAGPLYDGRIAPQLTALGPNGTSDAAAIVSGTVAVMQQVYADSNNQALPPSSLTKAILYNTADDIYNTGIDYKTGYGLINSYAALKAIQQKKYDGGTLSQGQQWTKNIVVPLNSAQLKVTLAYTDSAALVNNNKALINDIDLEVKELNTGIVYRPWVLNTTANASALAQLPTRKRDSLNTAEQVSIQLPGAGTYQVKVVGTSVSTPSLPFHISYNIDTLNTFAFTSPLHASDVNREEDENLAVRWKTFVADTNQTGNLYISYNLGATWQLLHQSQKLSANKYQWLIKDTNSVATFKMETPFGVFTSNNFIISKLTRLTVDFNCTDSVGLSWNKHIYANAYRIYTLTDSPYLKPILIVTDTAVVLQRSAYPSLVYAVEPVLSNGLAAARSVAINIDLQGVQCFYRTLNYNLLDFNRLNLQLELSAANYADSIFFEKVSATGQLLQTYGSAKAINSNLIYSQLVNEVPSGITYLRGRIKLKSGTIVYTDIIPVLTSGKKNILFYPNPAKRNMPLMYMLQQGIPADSQLQLYDVHGRLLKSFKSMPDKIDVSAFAPGMIIYKLLNSDNKTIETGKVVVQ
jgi:hypothetical protein